MLSILPPPPRPEPRRYDSSDTVKIPIEEIRRRMKESGYPDAIADDAPETLRAP